MHQIAILTAARDRSVQGGEGFGRCQNPEISEALWNAALEAQPPRMYFPSSLVLVNIWPMAWLLFVDRGCTDHMPRRLLTIRTSRRVIPNRKENTGS